MKDLEKIKEELKKISEEYTSKINALIDEMKQEKKENNRWRAEKDEYYFYIHPDRMNVIQTREDNDSTDNTRYKYHNYFKNVNEAQAVADNIKTHIELMELAEELNKEPIDWNNDNQEKYYLGFDFMPCGGIYQYFTYHYKNAYTVYCTNENFIKEAIKRIDEERLVKYLKGE